MAPPRWRSRVDVIIDLADDLAVQRAIHRRCHPASGRMVISPVPGTWEWRGVALPLYLALGEPPRHLEEWPPVAHQVPLLSDEDLIEPPDPTEGVQLPLFPDYEQVLARRLRFHLSGPPLTPSELRFHLQCARVRELYVLGAQAIRPAVWAALQRLGDDGVRLCLVVAGRRPTAAQLGALRRAQVRCRELRRRRDLRPWPRARDRSRVHPAPSPPPPPMPVLGRMPGPRAASTRVVELAALRRYGRWAQREGLRPDDPTASIELRRGEPYRDLQVLTADDDRRLLAAIPDTDAGARLRCLCLWYLLSGRRREAPIATPARAAGPSSGRCSPRSGTPPWCTPPGARCPAVLTGRCSRADGVMSHLRPDT